MRIISLAVWLSLTSAAYASAQRPGPPPERMRRGTFTAHSTASRIEGNHRSTERLDATIVFDAVEAMLKLGMPIGTLQAGRTGPIQLVSATGKVSYSGDEHLEGACPGPTSALGLSHTTHEEGGATWQADAGRFSVGFDPDGRVGAVTVAHPLRVTTKTTSPCPNVAPSSEIKERSIEGGFPIEIERAGDPRWSVDVHETPTGYAGSARFHKVENLTGLTGEVEGKNEVTKDFSFTLDLGGPLKPTGRAPMAGGGQPPVPPPGPPGAAMVAPGMAPVSKGEAVFVQGGKEARWPLASGGLMAMGGALGAAVLTYTPPGGGEGENTLALVVSSQGGPPAVTGLRLQGGPAGDAEYDKNSRGCAVQLDRSPPAGGIAGTITCTKGFDGVPITKLTFSATP